jgi:hypothetical protein
MSVGPFGCAASPYAETWGPEAEADAFMKQKFKVATLRA